MSKNEYTKTAKDHLRALDVSLLRYRCGQMLLMYEPIVRKTSSKRNRAPVYHAACWQELFVDYPHDQRNEDFEGMIRA
jgi:hypothetical protein